MSSGFSAEFEYLFEITGFGSTNSREESDGKQAVSSVATSCETEIIASAKLYNRGARKPATLRGKETFPSGVTTLDSRTTVRPLNPPKVRQSKELDHCGNIGVYNRRINSNT